MPSREQHRRVRKPIYIGRRGRACTNKKKYGEENARAYATKSGLNAYRCSFCGRWHVGGTHYA